MGFLTIDRYMTAGGFLILLLSAFLRKDRTQSRQDINLALVFLVYMAAGNYFLARLSRLNSPVRDVAFLRLDNALGFDTLGFMRWSLARAWAWKPLYVFYCMLFPAIVLAWVTERNRRMLWALLAGGLGCWFFYWQFPAIGPGWYDWLHHGPIPPEPRNCMPSMHLVWAILIAVNARGLPQRIAFSIYSVLIAVATLGLGEHYLIDLLAAVPYAAACQGVVHALPRLVRRWSLRAGPSTQHGRKESGS